MHSPDIYASGVNDVRSSHWSWLQQRHGKPIYMQHADERVPDSVEYPLESVASSLGLPFKYFELSAAYALALALTLDYDEIHIYGMDLVSDTEYKYQADCWRFWIGVAIGKGVELGLHCNAGLFSSKLYGYEGELALGSEYFTGRHSSLDALWRNADKQLSNQRRALERALAADDHDKAGRLAAGMIESALLCGNYAGAMSQAEYFAGYGDVIVSRQEYEKRAAQAQKDGEAKKPSMYHAGGKAEYVWNVWRASRSAQARDQFARLVKEQLELAYDVGALHGVYTECLSYLSEYDGRLQAAGGEKSLKVLTA